MGLEKNINCSFALSTSVVSLFQEISNFRSFKSNLTGMFVYISNVAFHLNRCLAVYFGIDLKAIRKLSISVTQVECN